MIGKKKQMVLLRTQNFFEKYPIILLLQHNNLTVEEWSTFRIKLNQINNINILAVKNSIIKKALLDNLNEKKANDVLSQNIVTYNTQSFTNSRISEKTNEIPCIDVKKLSIPLFQGPSFLIGCQDVSQLSEIWKFIKSTPNIVFIGGILLKQIVNHLDIEKFVQLDNSIYESFFEVLNSKSRIVDILNQSINFNVVLQIQPSLISILEKLVKYP